MRRFDLRGSDSADDLRRLFDNRLLVSTDSVEATVRDILDDVRQRGDNALLAYTRRFDFPDATTIRIPESAIQGAVARVQTTELWGAMERSAARIRRFHERQLRQSWMDFSRPGDLCGQRISPLNRVGIYVPGGGAAYPSTVLMVGIPAKVAGVSEIAITTPASKDTGLPPDATLAAAFLAGIDEVHAIGGAQAIGALAFGTETVKRVDKIVGPGSVWANVAKKLVYGVVGIDMLAGPSEVAILADDSADPFCAAADIIAQIEHDPQNAALLISTSEGFVDAVLDSLDAQLLDLPRAEIVRKSLENSFAVVASTWQQAIEIVNAYAPEHLHIDTRDPWTDMASVKNAGAILLGSRSNAALGDYMAGPSHTLPTNGCARYASPLNVDDFLKKTSIIALDANIADSLAADAQIFARFEGLEGHARAAKRRE